MFTFIDVSTFHLTITLESSLALAQEMCGQVTTLSVLNTSSSHCRVFTLIYVFATEAITCITGKARTVKAA
jgi:hypothetical protein